ncbi:MAG TPA: FtsQ-type POTRA domain-containing protein [Nitrospirae bacterium]|nr:cell division protein FtsQ [bacterium BMS3Bbin05]HDO36848.1 FtsQ-type POTRA domain-containing protein [Nitrospirota bacterium]
MAAHRKNKRRKKPVNTGDSAVRRRVFKAFFVIFLVVSLAVVSKVVVNRIVFFPVRNIKVIGNRHLSDREVSRIARLKKGVSIFMVHSKLIVKRLERSPWIKRVSLRKEMPDSIIIKIRESVPSALLKKGRAYYLLRSDGTILEKQNGDEKFLPVIKGNSGNKRAIREAVKLARVLREYGMDTNVYSEISISDLEDMTLQYGDTTIKVGYGDYETKLLRYMELRDEIARRGIPVSYIDLRYARRVIVRASKGERR